jgi:hypothetical protein
MVRMNKAKILTWEITGALIISLMGSLLHFIFAFSGEWPPVALIAAVNESVWEHLKLAFWPALIYALIEWPFFRRRTKNFWTAKSIGIFTMPVIITSFFYTYTFFIGHHILWLDISLFVFAVFTGQILSYRLLLCPSISSRMKSLAMILLALMIAAFSLFTFLPPHFPLFCDPLTGQYGILG